MGELTPSTAFVILEELFKNKGKKGERMKRTFVFLLAFFAVFTWLISPTAAGMADEESKKADTIKYLRGRRLDAEEAIAYFTKPLNNAGPLAGIGVRLSPAASDDVPSVVIYEVRKGFPAEKEGVLEGDVVLSVNGKMIKGKGVAALTEVIDEIRGDNQPGRKVTLELERKGKKMTVTMTTVVIQSDKTAGAKKLRKAIEEEGPGYIAALEKAGNALAEGLESGSLSMKNLRDLYESDNPTSDPRLLAFEKAMEDYGAWLMKKVKEIKLLLE